MEAEKVAVFLVPVLVRIQESPLDMFMHGWFDMMKICMEALCPTQHH